MDSIISVQDIRTSLGTIARKVEAGESFTVIRNSKPAFRIVPLASDVVREARVDYAVGAETPRPDEVARRQEKTGLQDIPIDRDRIAAMCKAWKIHKLSLFGSVLRADFRADSDIDVLVDFAADAAWDLFDLVMLKDKLEHLLRRKVDLVETKAITNPFRRKRILKEAQVLYEA